MAGLLRPFAKYGSLSPCHEIQSVSPSDVERLYLSGLKSADKLLDQFFESFGIALDDIAGDSR